MTTCSEAQVVVGWVTPVAGATEPEWVPLDMPVGEFKRRLWRWANTAPEHSTLLGTLASYCDMHTGLCCPKLDTLMKEYVRHAERSRGRTVPMPSARTQSRWLATLAEVGAFTAFQSRGKRNAYGTRQPTWFTAKTYRLNIAIDLGTGGVHNFLAPLPHQPDTVGVATEMATENATEMAHISGASSSALDTSSSSDACWSRSTRSKRNAKSGVQPSSPLVVTAHTEDEEITSAYPQWDHDAAQFGGYAASLFGRAVLQGWRTSTRPGLPTLTKVFTAAFATYGPDHILGAMDDWLDENWGNDAITNPTGLFVATAENTFQSWTEATRERESSALRVQQAEALTRRFRQRQAAHPRPSECVGASRDVGRFFVTCLESDFTAAQLSQAMDRWWDHKASPPKPGHHVSATDRDFVQRLERQGPAGLGALDGVPSTIAG